MTKKDRIPLIAIKDLTWGYPQQTKPLFKKLNFDLFPGDFTIIIGKSGVGKSTLVRFLIGELRPYSKTVYYRMDDLSTLNDEEIQRYRRKVGIIFQDDKLIHTLSIKENIIYPLRLEGETESSINSKYRAIITKLQLEDQAKTTSKHISGGEKQKVAIARAMIHNPEFIIADEPTGNLDWEYTQEIGDLLIEANKGGNSIILITHDIHLLNYIKTKTNVNIFQM
ncbi:MAG: ATP-binding cassette domain-containing protein [Candidatus Peribacteria bacterium]|jgi:cell division transport system ATP-binding protein|nr:ATP-binding cassette domain-containing protein [Candidatus Peribacteria bacterium]